MLDLGASQHCWLFWNLTWPCIHYKQFKMKWNTGAAHKKKYFVKTFENFASDVSCIAQAPPQLSVVTQTLAKNLARLLLRLVTQVFPVNLSGTAKVIRLTCARGEGSFFLRWLRITGWCRLHNTCQQTQNVLTGAVQDGPAQHRRKHVETHCCLWLKKKEHTGSHIPGCAAYLDTLWDGLIGWQSFKGKPGALSGKLLPSSFWYKGLNSGELWVTSLFSQFFFLHCKLAFPWHTYNVFRETFHFIQTPCSRVSLFKPRQQHCFDLTNDCHPPGEICVSLRSNSKGLQLNIIINT